MVGVDVPLQHALEFIGIIAPALVGLFLAIGAIALIVQGVFEISGTAGAASKAEAARIMPQTGQEIIFIVWYL